jgi:pimeloyl-ACP methyl ester carboxylesterase
MSAIILFNDLVHYEVLGRGRPVIFLHGWVGSWRYWVPTMQAASTTFRTYALDLWGFGDSSKNAARYSVTEQVALLESFMDRLGIGKVAIIGHGLGGLVGLSFAARYPKFVDRLMSVSLPVGAAQVHPRLRTDSAADLADWLLGRGPETEAARDEALKADRIAIQASLAALDPAAVHKQMAGMATPCLLVHGLNDPAVSQAGFESPGLELPESAHAILFEQSAHYPMLEEAAKFNRLMADFLALKPGESPRQLQLKEEWKRRVR